MMRREMRVLDALAGTDVPAPAAVRRVPGRDRPRRRRGLLSDGGGRRVQPDASRCRRCTRATRRSATRWGSPRSTRRPRSARVDHEARRARRPRASPTASSSARCRGGSTSSRRTRATRATPGRTSRARRRRGAGSTRTGPRRSRPASSHGDYHLANLLYRYDGPEVAAIVDWEMCTVGDPLLDLGWLLATWPTAAELGLGRSAQRGRRAPDPRRARRPLRRAVARATCPRSPGTRSSPASSSASCSRARTPARSPARRRSRWATCCTPPPWCSSATRKTASTPADESEATSQWSARRTPARRVPPQQPATAENGE